HTARLTVSRGRVPQHLFAFPEETDDEQPTNGKAEPSSSGVTPAPPQPTGHNGQINGTAPPPAPPQVASGEKAKAREILAAIRTLKQLEQEQRPANPDEREALARYGGFGAIA